MNVSTIKKFFVITLLIVGFSNMYAGHAQAAVEGDGILFYSASGNTIPQVETYDNATNDFSVTSDTIVGAQPAINVIKTSPTKQEAIAAYQDTSGNLRVMCYDGTAWTNEWSIAVAPTGTPTTRRFDVAYETNTGDVTVAYSRNTAAANALAYRTKAGSTGCGSANWAGAANFPTTPVGTSATVQWVKAVRDGRASSNLNAWVWLDNAATAADLGGAIWSGTAFTNIKAIETSMEHITAVGDTDNFDVQFESLSGDVMVVWGNSAGASGVNGYRYMTCTGGTSACTWSALSTVPTTLDDVMMIDLSADPLSDNMAMAGIGTASADMSAGYWSGTAWTGYANVDTTTEGGTAGTKKLTTGWLTNGANTKWYLSYDDASGVGLSYKYAIPGSALTSPTDYSATPALNDIRDRYDTDMNPFNTAELIQTVSDSTNGIFAYKLSMDATGALTWSNMTSAVSLGTKPSTPQQGFHYTYWRFIPIPVTTLTISQTAGSKVTTKNSGDVNQYAHDTACTGAANCSAFTLASAGGTTNVTSIKITESGTVTANTELSDLNLYYDYDGNWADAGAETLFGTVANFAADQTATVSGTLAITDGATAYIYARYDLANGAVYPVGGATVNFQIAAFGDVVSDATESGTGSLVGTQTVKPQITGYTNSTEPALDYAGACTGCGARIGGGSGFRHTVVISGYGFGADPGLGSRDTVTNKVEIAGTATTVLADDASANTNVSAWSNTSITIRTDSNIATNTDTDFGTNFGGATALKVTAGGQAVPTNLNFYIFPQITSITQPGGFPADSAREYDAGDTDGVITLNGTRFGSLIGTGSVTILGSGATTNSWSNTAIEARVPAAIADNSYTGAVAMTQGTGGNSKTHSYSTLRILPRITSLVPANGIIGTAVTVNGDHLCQAGAASCPVAFGANDKVTFTSAVVATTFTSWSNTAIVTAVPTGAVTGSVVVTSNTPPAYTSNALTFTVNANTTTLATGSDPVANTIAPGATATDVDLFTLQTNGGTESVTSVTINLSTNSGIGLLAITDNANTVLGSTASPVTGSNVITVAGMSAGTGLTTFKVRVTPLSHASMPVPAGGAYAITAPVTAWAGSNTHAGSDTNTNALTIDNASPAGTTGATPTAGDTQVQLSWTNPGDGDFQKVIIYCKTSSITETPTEGSDPTVDVGACDATARVKYSGSASPQTITGLSNGTLYYFRIYARDTNGNFTAIASTQEVSATPTLTQALTVGTVGTQAVNLNSGSTAQHIGGAGTAAFTLQINTGSSNVTSVKVSDTGTVAIANLANPKLYYENAVNAASCAYGGAESFVSGAAPVGETVTFTLPSVAVGLTANVTCLYFVSDVTSSAVGGQTIELEITNPSTDVSVSSGVNTDTVAKAITGTTTVKPQITGYTNSTEPALDYAGACTGCGARIGGGSGFRHTVVISGYGFGADPGLGSRDTVTNKVEIAGTATTVLADDASANTNVSAWSNTSITIRTDSNIATNTDTDFGTNFGGATALKVTAGGQAVPTNLNFYIFPQITSITQPGGFPADSAREYDAGDTDGVITLNGTRFGSLIGTGSVTILGSGATTNSWSNTAIEARVPAAIADNSYTGAVAMTQGTGGNSKTHSYSTLRILPRITSLVPANGIIGTAVTVNGDHLCQAGAASCPVAFGANDKVTFTSAVVATTFTSWSNTAIVTAVPTGAVTGNVVVTSNAPTYTSNGSMFTLVSTTPTDPTNLIQKDANLATIATGGTSSSTPIRYTFDTSSGVTGGTMYAQVEVRPVIGANKDFTSTCSANPYCFEGLGTAYSGGTINLLATSSPADDIYHWQARVCYNKNGTHTTACDGTGDNPSALWVSYGGNAETATDFKVDATAPVISSPSSSGPPVPGTNTATITWTTDEPSTSQVQYQAVAQASCTAYSFASSCSTNNNCTAVNASLVYSPHTTSLSNLNSGTAYCYRVRSKDAVGNERMDTNNYWFTTDPISTPAKTTSFYIVGSTATVTSASPLSQTFSVVMPENATSTKSIFVEIKGIYDITATSPAPSFTVQVNSETSKTYALPAVVSKSYFKILHQVNAINISPASNTLTITPDDTNTNIHVSSADINVTYGYTP